ncbi:MAG: MFS transporter [Proteobacteria bacterium]|nr:MFS transporter [Pseudomonadota bacterium]
MKKSFTQSWLVGAISIGTVLEWAEYTFYGYMAVALSALFFPENNPEIAILKTFGIFAMGYLMRPLGAILFGHIGDCYGRKLALICSLSMMGAATFCIGCLPTYYQIGMSAPLLLLLMRMLQGIAISGEYNGAGIYLVEKIGTSNPSLAGSWISASAAAGMVIGGIAAFVTNLPQAPVWAWRVPFLLGGLSCFLGFWLRRGMTETQKRTVVNLPIPLIQVLKQHKRAFLSVAAIAAFTGIFVYIGNIYIVVFLKQQVKLPTHHASFFAIFGEVIVCLLIPILGYIADKTCPYRQYRWGLLLIIVGAPCIFLLCLTGNYFYILLAMVLYGIFNAIVCGPMVKIMCDQFPQGLRYTGISLAWSVSAAIFSGTGPLVAQWLVTRYDWLLGPSFYVSMIALIVYVILGITLRSTSFVYGYHLKELTD